MTLHVPYDHSCPNCQAAYIPYDADVACPNCGLVEEQRFVNFIPLAVASALYNLKQGRSYVPGMWWAGTLGDRVLHVVFHILEEHRTGARGHAFEDVATKSLDDVNWGSMVYGKEHVFRIACRVHDEVRKIRRGRLLFWRR